MNSSASVLVIEDSPVVQHLLRATLAPLGLDVLTAADGESGLEMARFCTPDLITLDIGLPGMNGWQVLSELRDDSETSRIGVIVLTAHTQKSLERVAFDLGADRFLAKPFRPAELRSQAESLLALPRLGFRFAVGQ